MDRYDDIDSEDLMAIERHPVNDGSHTYYTNPGIAKENPVFQSSMYEDEPGHSTLSLPYATQGQQSIARRDRVRTAKDTSRGIEDIVMVMPSRTIGRKTGKRIAKANSSLSSRSSYSRHMQAQILTHQDNINIDGVRDDVAHQYYEEIAEQHGGEVPVNDIRSLAVNMRIKKQIRNRVLSNRDRKMTSKIGSWKLWRYNMAIKRERLVESFRKRIHSPKLWRRDLKQVEGNFGSGVSSYFIFLRGLFFLSIPSFILNFAFISLPQILDLPARNNPNITFTGEELLTGANWLTETIMYYGYYTNGNITVIEGSSYQMPLAYLLASAGYFLLCLIWLSRLTATSFRDNYIQGQVSYSNFIGKTFCSWDYAITSGSVAKLHQKIITTDLKEVLAERLRQRIPRSASRTCEIYMLRLLVWLVYFAVAGGAAVLVYYLNARLLYDISKPLEGIPVIEEVMLAVIVSAINLVTPIAINLGTHLERYKNPRHELYIAVFRNFLLKLGMLGVICAFWTDENLQTYQVTENVTETRCWETELGQEIYRLVIIDFFFSIIFATFCAEFLRKIFSMFCCKNLEKAEFSIVNNVMDLIYGQTLCWLGVFFCPLLALIVIIKYFLMFYIKKISVTQNCQAAKKRWRAAQSQTMFYGLLLISFLLSAFFLCVVVFRKTPSPECGPYRGLNRTYDAIILVFNDLSISGSDWFTTIMTIITSVWFLSAINTILVVLVVMRRSRTIGLASLGKALRQQIALEGRDKVLLLTWLQQLSNQEGPSAGAASKPGKKHRVPILAQHKASAGSTPAPQRPHQSPARRYGEPLTGGVLTHADPQHVGVSNLDPTGSPVLGRKRHRDPVLNRALANKEKQQRPYSMFVDNADKVNPPPQRNSFSGEIEMEFIDKSATDNDSDSSQSSSRPPSFSPLKGSVYMQNHV